LNGEGQLPFRQADFILFRFPQNQIIISTYLRNVDFCRERQYLARRPWSASVIVKMVLYHEYYSFLKRVTYGTSSSFSLLEVLLSGSAMGAFLTHNREHF